MELDRPVWAPVGKDPLCIALHYTTPNYTTLHYTTLHCITLHYTTLHCAFGCEYQGLKIKWKTA